MELLQDCSTPSYHDCVEFITSYIQKRRTNASKQSINHKQLKSLRRRRRILYPYETKINGHYSTNNVRCCTRRLNIPQWTGWIWFFLLEGLCFIIEKIIDYTPLRFKDITSFTEMCMWRFTSMYALYSLKGDVHWSSSQGFLHTFLKFNWFKEYF